MQRAAQIVKPRPGAALERRLHRVYGGLTLAFIAFVLGLGVLENMGLPDNWIGLIFLVRFLLQV